MVGIVQMWKGTYSPSTFTRVVWVLLAVNSFAGLLLTSTSQSAIVLGVVFLAGNVGMCLFGFWKGNRSIGRVELICLGLLVISGIIWIFFRVPLVNLLISFLAHFIGGIPTIKRAWLNPRDESVAFWSLFFFGSLLSLFGANNFSFKEIAFPLYFTLFDGGMFFLSMRKGKIDISAETAKILMNKS